MSTLILDDFIKNMIIVEEEANKIVPLTDYEIIFEAFGKKNEKVIDVMKNNEESMAASKKGLKNIIDIISKLISTILDSIQEFFSSLTIGGDEKARLKEFRKQMEADPSLRNKKVTIRDFREIEKEYNALEKEIEDEIRRTKNDEDRPTDRLINKITGFLKKSGKATTKIVTAETALKYAESNQNAARLMQKTVMQSENFVNGLIL